MAKILMIFPSVLTNKKCLLYNAMEKTTKTRRFFGFFQEIPRAKNGCGALDRSMSTGIGERMLVAEVDNGGRKG